MRLKLFSDCSHCRLCASYAKHLVLLSDHYFAHLLKIIYFKIDQLDLFRLAFINSKLFPAVNFIQFYLNFG